MAKYIVKLKNKVVRMDIKDEYFVHGLFEKSRIQGSKRPVTNTKTVGNHNGYFLALNTQTNKVDLVKVVSDGQNHFNFEQIIIEDKVHPKTHKVHTAVCSKYYLVDDTNKKFFGDDYIRSKLFHKLYVKNSSVKVANKNVLLIPIEQIFVDINDIFSKNYQAAKVEVDKNLHVKNNEDRNFDFYKREVAKCLKLNATKSQHTQVERMLLKLIEIIQTDMFKDIFNSYIERNKKVDSFICAYYKKISKVEAEIKETKSMIEQEQDMQKVADLHKKLNRLSDKLTNLKDNIQSDIDEFKQTLPELPTFELIPLTKHNVEDMSK